MKKTLTVNLGGTVFHIDEDAYQLLDAERSFIMKFISPILRTFSPST